MASELSWRETVTGNTDYATIRSAARQMWSTAGSPALENLTVANWANYAISLSESPASSYFYVGNWPAGLTTAGWYWVDVYKQVGGSPAISDTFLGTLIGWWNGTVFTPWSGDAASVGGTTQTACDLGAQLANAVPTVAQIQSGVALSGAVAAIPTNPLLTTDSRLTNIVVGIANALTAIAAIPTDPYTGTPPTVNQIQSGLALSGAVAAIPTNPLLTNDARITTLVLGVANALTAIAAVPDVAAIASAVFSETGITQTGTPSFAQICAVLYAMACGKLSVSGSTVTLYADDGTTVLKTFTITTSGRV